MINAAMEAERQQHIGASPNKCSPARRTHANGFKMKTIKNRVGPITFDVPQVREGDFYPDELEKGLRSGSAFTLALLEMYVEGVSTRKVSAITDRLCGTSITCSQVSRAAAQLDEVLEAWRNRPLAEFIYITLDAQYHKVCQDRQIRDAAMLRLIDNPI